MWMPSARVSRHTGAHCIRMHCQTSLKAVFAPVSGSIKTTAPSTHSRGPRLLFVVVVVVPELSYGPALPNHLPANIDILDPASDQWPVVAVAFNRSYSRWRRSRTIRARSGGCPFGAQDAARSDYGNGLFMRPRSKTSKPVAAQGGINTTRRGTAEPVSVAGVRGQGPRRRYGSPRVGTCGVHPDRVGTSSGRRQGAPAHSC